MVTIFVAENLMMKSPQLNDVKDQKKIFSSLRSRNRLYFSGQGISLTGTWMQKTALRFLL